MFIDIFEIKIRVYFFTTHSQCDVIKAKIK